jgi:hypothetical protein
MSLFLDVILQLDGKTMDLEKKLGEYFDLSESTVLKTQAKAQSCNRLLPAMNLPFQLNLQVLTPFPLSPFMHLL